MRRDETSQIFTKKPLNPINVVSNKAAESPPAIRGHDGLNGMTRIGIC